MPRATGRYLSRGIPWVIRSTLAHPPFFIFPTKLTALSKTEGYLCFIEF